MSKFQGFQCPVTCYLYLSTVPWWGYVLCAFSKCVLLVLNLCLSNLSQTGPEHLLLVCYISDSISTNRMLLLLHLCFVTENHHDMLKCYCFVLSQAMNCVGCFTCVCDN